MMNSYSTFMLVATTTVQKSVIFWQRNAHGNLSAMSTTNVFLISECQHTAALGKTINS